MGVNILSPRSAEIVSTVWDKIMITLEVLRNGYKMTAQDNNVFCPYCNQQMKTTFIYSTKRILAQCVNQKCQYLKFDEAQKAKGNEKMAVVEIKASDNVPTAEYPVQITDAEDEQGKFGPQTKLTCEILTGDFQGTQKPYWLSVSGSMKSKMAKAANACGLPFEEDTSFDTQWFLGRQCIALIVTQTKDDGTEYNKIMELKPIPAKKAKAPGAVAPKAPPAGGYAPPPQTTTFDNPGKVQDPFEEE
jgi:hypothetical protein